MKLLDILEETEDHVGESKCYELVLVLLECVAGQSNVTVVSKVDQPMGWYRDHSEHVTADRKV